VGILAVAILALALTNAFVVVLHAYEIVRARRGQRSVTYSYNKSMAFEDQPRPSSSIKDLSEPDDPRVPDKDKKQSRITFWT